MAEPGRRTSAPAKSSKGDKERQMTWNDFASIASTPRKQPLSTASDVVFRGSRVFTDDTTPESSDALETPEDQEDPAAQMRRAQLLHETAIAMDGGKSLAMVHPEASTSSSSSGSSTSSTSAPSTALAGDYSGTAHFSRRQPTTSRMSSYDSRETIATRRTAYFTPPSAHDDLPDEAQDYVSYEKHGENNAASPLSEEPMAESEVDGLGLRLSTLHASPSNGGRSPATLRAASPDASTAGGSPRPQPSRAESDRQSAKMADRRSRTIRELIETEAIYASDMAVVRDIYLARAQGADINDVAHAVMSSGLGLGNIVGDVPPTPSISQTSPNLSSSQMGRRPTLIRTSLTSSRVVTPDGEALMSPKDLTAIFSNLEAIAGFAEAFSGLLDGAWTAGTEENMEDRVGEVFMEQLPRIQKLYSTYCSKHDRAIIRLQELEPALTSYLAECKTLSVGRTNAWDLASLLIKPVQRCLKYPLLLSQILASTPEEHPDRYYLQLAHKKMLTVAEHINEFKKRSDLVGRIVNKNEPRTGRRESSFGRAVTKKLLRSSQKAKNAVGFGNTEKDDSMFDTLSALVDSTRSSVLRFATEMREWSRSTKVALESQLSMVEGWIEVYAPMADEGRTVGGGHERLCVFLDHVLRPVLDGPFRALDHEIRRSLLVKTDHLLSLFENPRAVIAKRNDKMLDHSRYMLKKLPSDKRGSDEFLTLSGQLLEELPRFLGSVSKYFNIIVGGFAAAQSAYHGEVVNHWTPFAEQWFTQIPQGNYDSIEESFRREHQPVAAMMETLACGLGISASQLNSSTSSRRPSLTSMPSVRAPLPAPGERRGSQASSSEYSINSYYNTAEHRLSHHSDASTPSFTHTGSSVGSPVPATPPPLIVTAEESSKGGDAYDFPASYQVPMPTEEDSHLQAAPSFLRPPSNRPAVEEAARVVQRLSVYLDENYDYTQDPEEFEEEEEEEPPVLYVAEAINVSRAGDMFRDGYAVLSFDVGENLFVQYEEADHASGGSGWLLGRKGPDGQGELGWGRSEDFCMLD
ncbi:hypothetical protein MNV49_003081 [Pseudohyphozyma bogoriensis]|nr:hypothetical protein MNV49_003081 [Pseudohyphozyma bogoriensis]